MAPYVGAPEIKARRLVLAVEYHGQIGNPGQYTVEDDKLYTQPWTGELSMSRHDGPLYEYACHEGNYSMPLSLRGARAQERQEAAPR